tara:strand:+ start:131 stop:346 length:216 start_codon:yes stop_codon:yes gene_type:complete
MNVGDLVFFKPKQGATAGALTAVKYYKRLSEQTEGLPGVIVNISGSNCSVIFGNKIIVVNKALLETASECR